MDDEDLHFVLHFVATVARLVDDDSNPIRAQLARDYLDRLLAEAVAFALQAELADLQHFSPN